MIIFFHKRAFTLVEVLITLGIIGLVATLTIPALVSKINDLEYRSQYKNLFTELSEAYAQMNINNNNDVGIVCDYYAAGTGNAASSTNCFVRELSKYLKVIKICDYSSSQNNCTYSSYEKYLSGATSSDKFNEYSGAGMVLANGAMLDVYWQVIMIVPQEIS